MLVALELFLEKDHARERREYDKRAETIRASGCGACRASRPRCSCPRSPTTSRTSASRWDGADEAKAAAAVVKAMKDGEPSIGDPLRGQRRSCIGVWMMRPGEEKIVARRLRRCWPPRKTGLMTARRRPGLLSLVLAALVAAPGAALVRRARQRRACASPPTSLRATTSASRTACPSACATVSRCMRTSTGRWKEGRYPVDRLANALQHRTFPSAYDAAVYFAQRGYVYVFQDIRGRHESDGSGSRSSTTSGTATTPSSGPPSSRGRTARWACRAAPISGRTSGGPHRPRPPASSPSSRWSPRRASTTTGSRSTAAGGCHSTSAGGRSGRNRESCRTPGPTRSRACDAIHYDQVQWHLPLSTMQQLVGRKARFYDDWLAHPDYNAYWKPLNVGGDVREDQGSGPHVRRLVRHLQPGDAARLRWHEPEGRNGARHGRGAISSSGRGATGRRRSSASSTSGPRPTWTRCASASLVRLLAARASTTASPSEPPVKLFVMGRNEWVYEREYPLARTDYRPFYFASGGSANGDKRRRPAELGRSRRRRPRRTASATIPPNPVPSWAATTAAARRRRPARRISVRSKAGGTFSSTPPTC